MADTKHSIMQGETPTDSSVSDECSKVRTRPGAPVSAASPDFVKEEPDVETNPLLGDSEKTSKDPDEVPEDEGQLSDLPPIDVFSREYFGYLPQYFAVGIVSQGLPSMVYGFFLGYLNVPAYVYSTALTVVSMPWTFKFFIGMLSDCVPIRGLRRKPYICLGWLICFAMLLGLAFSEVPDPYYCKDEQGKYITKTYRDGKHVPAEACNAAAANAGGKFAMLMMAAVSGMMIADVAADGMTVEIARREPVHQRGYTQTTVYLTRSFGQVCAVALVAFGMNGYEYNGSFEWTLSFNTICGIIAAPVAAMVPLSYFGIPESPVPDQERDSFSAYSAKVWELLTGRAMFFVLVYQFCTPVVGSISTTAAGHVKMEWAGVQNLQNQLFTLFGLLLFAAGLYLVRSRLLNASWRWMLAVTTIFLIALDSIFVYLTIFDVVRDQYFYLGETVLMEIPAAANFVIGTFVIVEMAQDGTEGIVYGMLTTAHNLGHPLARAIANQVYRLFEPSLSSKDGYIEDSPHFREVVAWSFALSYFLGLLSLVFLYFLPNQKKQAQNRKQLWGHHNGYAYTACITLGLAMLYALTVNFLSMNEDTMCLQFAGGDGCDKKKDANEDH